MNTQVVLLSLLWCLVEAHSQTVPYVTFMGETLPNHAYVNLSEVGLGGTADADSGDELVCHSDLTTCCRGTDLGHWYFPNGTQLQEAGSDNVNPVPIAERKLDQRVRLQRGPVSGDIPSGVYRCDIETVAVHSNNDLDTTTRETVYVGVYGSGGNIMLPGGTVSFVVDSDLNGASPQFTLTCISIGGPATNVAWTRDSGTAIGNEKTELNNAETAQYTHTLTVNGRLGGLYACTVSNRLSGDEATITVEVASAPTDLVAVERHHTTIQLYWSPPTPLGDTTGYRIYYSGGSSGSEDVSGGSTDNYLLPGLQSGASYAITIVGTSRHFPSSRVEVFSSGVYLSLNGEVISNHSYLEISDIGPTAETALVCNTPYLYNGSDNEVGNWFGPDDTRVRWIDCPQESCVGTLYPGFGRSRAPGIARLIRDIDSGDPLEGMYRCEIQDTTWTLQTVYVGLYNSGHGSVNVNDVTLTVDSDLNGASPQFTLTCISTGGPATNIIWIRDSGTVIGHKMTVLNNLFTAQYTHSLTVTGRLGGLYTCNVSNRLSGSGTTFIVKVASTPTNLVAVQEGTTSIHVSWSLPAPLGDTTGYMIYYSAGSSGSVSVSDGSMDNYLLTDLQNGDNYTISVAGRSQHLPGDTMIEEVFLVPGQPSVSVESTTPTSISLCWSVPSGSVVDSYEVMWQRDTSGECSDEDEGNTTITGISSSFTIMGLAGISSYTITVTATNAAGSSTVSSAISGMTLEAAPSAAPTPVNVPKVTASSITVQWGTVDCIHHNGDVTGYSVRYGVQGSGSTQTMSVSVSDATQAIISGLIPSTVYTIEVAAVTRVGTGVYSSPTFSETDDPLSAVVVSTFTASLSISWTLDDSVTATSYSISFSNTNNTQCFTDSNEIVGVAAASETIYTLTDLQEATEYSITLTAVLSDGETAEYSLTATTMAAVPSTFPTSVSVSDVTSSSITVQWGAVDCIHRNGDITGYSVRYGVQGSGSTQTMSVPGGSITDTTISNLMSSTTYSIEVAAVNWVGTGKYSNPPITVEIPSSVFLSLNGSIIPIHGYLEISDVGSTDDTALLCNTNRPVNADNSGDDWLGPDGSRVGSVSIGTDDVPGFIRNRDPGIVRLLRNTATDPPSEGVYHCEIEDDALTVKLVYVGLYNNREGKGGDVMISQNMELRVDSDLNGASPQFTLICISTGGPATNVTWTRDSEVFKGSTILTDAVTAEYTHTLTITGRLGGLYTCSVSNDKPSMFTARFLVEVASAPTNVTAVQEGLTSIRVSWSPPTPLGNTTGYRIYYSGHSSRSSSEDVSGGSIENYLLTGLQSETTYTISIGGTSRHFPSDSVVQDVTLVPIPSRPSVSVYSTTATSISLSWSVPSNTVVISYEVMWKVSRSVGGNHSTTMADDEGTSGVIASSSTSYTIEQLESSTAYTITVRVANAAGNTVSQPTVVSTSQEGAQTSNTVAVTGGVVVAVVVILCITTAIVVVVILRTCRRKYSIAKRHRDAMDIPYTNNEAYVLSNFAETIAYEHPGGALDMEQTGGADAYETVTSFTASLTVPMPTLHPSQLPAAAVEPLYEEINPIT